MYEKKKRKKSKNKKKNTYSPQRTPLMVTRNKLRKLKRQRSLIQKLCLLRRVFSVLIETKSAVREKRSLLAFRAALGRIKEEQKYRSARKTTDIVVLYEKDEESRDTKKNDQETSAMEDCFVNLMIDGTKINFRRRFVRLYVFSFFFITSKPPTGRRRRRHEAAIAADESRKKRNHLR